MRRCGYQNLIAMSLTNTFEITANYTKTCISPAAPEFGCKLTPANPVIIFSSSLRFSINLRYPSAWSSGTNGCMHRRSGRLSGNISAAAFSFMVHEPSRDHRLGKRDILAVQSLDVTHHFRFRMVFIEYFVGKECTLAFQFFRECIGIGDFSNLLIILLSSNSEDRKQHIGAEMSVVSSMLKPTSPLSK